MNYKNFNHKGFTLIEIAVVVLITSMLFGFAVVSFGAINRQNLNIAASMMAEDIRLTQQLSLNQDGEYRIIFDCSNEKYYITKEVKAYKIVNLPAGVDLYNTNFPFHELKFNQKGTPSQGGTVTLSNRQRNYLYVIVMPVTGRVRIDTKLPV
jgi:prepilin-type N-terminal cleavage/methylation domain-containing protein